MGISEQYKEGEYIVTLFENGAIEKVIDQEGKANPVPVSIDPFAEINAKMDKVLSGLSEIKALLSLKV